MGNAINRGFNPYDTIRKTPHGKFISWISSSSTPVTNEKKKTKQELMFETYKKDIERTARKSFIEKEEYFDIETGETKYKYHNVKPKPVQEKSTWQKIKDWWNGDSKKVDDVSTRYKFKDEDSLY